MSPQNIFFFEKGPTDPNLVLEAEHGYAEGGYSHPHDHRCQTVALPRLLPPNAAVSTHRFQSRKAAVHPLPPLTPNRHLQTLPQQPKIRLCGRVCRFPSSPIFPFEGESSNRRQDKSYECRNTYTNRRLLLSGKLGLSFRFVTWDIVFTQIILRMLMKYFWRRT